MEFTDFLPISKDRSVSKAYDMNYMGCYSDNVISDLIMITNLRNEICGERCYNTEKTYAATQYRYKSL